MKRFLISVLIPTFSTLLVGGVLVAQSNRSAPAAGDWPMYSYNLAGTRFSPLTDINGGNVGSLAQAWSVRLTQPAGRRGGGPPADGEEGAPVAGRGAGAAGNPAAAQVILRRRHAAFDRTWRNDPLRV